MGILNKILKPIVTPAEITGLLVSNRTDLVGDVIYFADKSRGENNTTPQQPSTSGLRSLFDAGGYTTNRTGLTVARGLPAGATLTSDLSLMFCGENNNSNFLGLGYNDRHSNSLNTWTSLTSVSSQVRNQLGGTSVTTDTSLALNGYSAPSTYCNNVDKFTNSTNAWAVRAVVYAVFGNSTASLTTDLSLSYNGSNAGGYVNANNRYSDSGNSWTVLTVVPVTNCSGAGASFTSDTAFSMVGRNSTTAYRFHNSANTWIARTNPQYGKYYISGCSMTSDLAYQSSGNSNVGCTERFSDSMNIWMARPNFMNLRFGTTCTSFTSTNILNSGGYNNTLFYNNVERFIDQESVFKSGRAFFSNTPNGTPEKPTIAQDDSQHVYTKTLYNINPNVIYVGVLEEKNDSTVVAMTIDISPDGGTTWPLTDQAINTGLNISALTVSDLRLRFNLKRNSNGGVWTARASLSRTRTRAGAARLTSDIGLSFAGENVANAGLDTPALTDRYLQSANSWTTLNTSLTPGKLLASNDLTSDLFLTSSPSQWATYSSRFSYSANIYIQRSTSGNYNGCPAGPSMTSDLGIICQPFSSIHSRYSDSANNWTSRTLHPEGSASYTPAGSSFNTDQYIMTTNVSSISRRFSDSANAWTTRSNSAWGVALAYDSMASLNNDSTIRTGYNGGSDKYFDSANAWAIRGNRPELGGNFIGTFAQTSNSVMVCGGDTPSATVYRYTDGESMFKGFAIK